MAHIRSRSQFVSPSRPGWYPDGTGQLRYFNGQMWTEGRRPLPALKSFVSSAPHHDSPLADPRVPRRRVRKAIALGMLSMLLVGIAVQLLAIVVPHAPSAQLVAFQERASRACAGAVLDIAPLSQAGARQEDQATLETASRLERDDSTFAANEKVPAEMTWTSAWGAMVSSMKAYLGGTASFATVSARMSGVRSLAVQDGISGCSLQTNILSGGAVSSSR